MNTTLTIKIEKKLRNEAKRAAESMGLPLTTAVNAMLKKFVRDRVLVLEAECPFPSHTPNAETRKAILDVQNYMRSKTKRGSHVHKGDKIFGTIEEFETYMKAL